MKKEITPTEIDALIRLLDDTDEEVYSHISERLITFGPSVIPKLESVWSSSLDALMQSRIEEIIHKIQLEVLQKELKDWANSEQKDMLNGAILVARYQYPDLNETKIREQIDKIRRDAWLELNDELTALEQVKVLNRVFFDMHGFSGNTQNFHAPQNSDINIVLETKKGNPLMLSLIYCKVANELSIPLYGINLPEHFVLGYKDETNVLPLIKQLDRQRILFYINCFSKGDICGRKEIDQFLKQLKIKPEPQYYEPCSPVDMIQRLIRNLMNSFYKLGEMDKVHELELLMEATEKGK
jgi:regulator of sirC expression with transglutaminase-like and TPR domain